jgi:hypothetical protein
VIDRDRLGERLTRERASFAAARPRSQAAAGEAGAHLVGGVPMTHNMALMAPTTTDADVDLHTEVFAEVVADLVG